MDKVFSELLFSSRSNKHHCEWSIRWLCFQRRWWYWLAILTSELIKLNFNSKNKRVKKESCNNFNRSSSNSGQPKRSFNWRRNKYYLILNYLLTLIYQQFKKGFGLTDFMSNKPTNISNQNLIKRYNYYSMRVLNSMEENSIKENATKPPQSNKLALWNLFDHFWYFSYPISVLTLERLIWVFWGRVWKWTG